MLRVEIRELKLAEAINTQTKSQQIGITTNSNHRHIPQQFHSYAMPLKTTLYNAHQSIAKTRSCKGCGNKSCPAKLNRTNCVNPKYLQSCPEYGISPNAIPFYKTHSHYSILLLATNFISILLLFNIYKTYILFIIFISCFNIIIIYNMFGGFHPLIPVVIIVLQ